MSETPKTFHERLIQARLEARQTPGVMATMLGMSEEAYQELEEWRYPDNETLKRLCVMMDWNYYDHQRYIINEMVSPTRKSRQNSGPATMSTLAERMQEVRSLTGHSTDILALMLGITEEEYLRIEGGESPKDETLRRISIIYNWNYQELLYILRCQNAGKFQPVKVGMPFLNETRDSLRLRQVLRDIEKAFRHLPQESQQRVLGQIELVAKMLEPAEKAEGSEATSPTPPPRAHPPLLPGFPHATRASLSPASKIVI